MNKFHTLLATGALVAAAALPAAAEPGNGQGDPMKGMQTEAHSPAAQTAAMEAQMAAGTTVVAADGADIGTVQDAQPQADGDLRLVIALNDDLPIAAQSISLDVPAEVVTGDVITLSMTEAQLVDSIATPNAG